MWILDTVDFAYTHSSRALLATLSFIETRFIPIRAQPIADLPGDHGSIGRQGTMVLVTLRKYRRSLNSTTCFR